MQLNYNFQLPSLLTNRLDTSVTSGEPAVLFVWHIECQIGDLGKELMESNTIFFPESQKASIYLFIWFFFILTFITCLIHYVLITLRLYSISLCLCLRFGFPTFSHHSPVATTATKTPFESGRNEEQWEHFWWITETTITSPFQKLTQLKTLSSRFLQTQSFRLPSCHEGWRRTFRMRHPYLNIFRYSPDFQRPGNSVQHRKVMDNTVHSSHL